MNFAALIVFLPLLLFCTADLDCFFGEMEVQRNGTMVCERDPSYMFDPYVIGCIIPDHTILERDRVAFLGQKMFECQNRREGRDVELIETMNVAATCDNGVRSGVSWIEANAFKYECAPYGQIRFVACITPGGTEVLPQETKMVGNVDVTCRRYNNGTVTMTASKQPSEYDCQTWTGESKAYGSIWVESKYIHVYCSTWGRVEFLGCALPNRFSDDLMFGKYYESGPAYFFCDRRNNKYTLHVNDPEEEW